MILHINEIWEKVKEGDPEAWEKLVRRYAGLVNTVALRAGLAVSDAEDCAQHTWMALYRRRKAIKDPSGLPAWLILTTRRQAIRMLRQQSRRDELGPNLEAVDSTIPPDEELLRLERVDMLQYAMEHLDKRCQRLLRALFTSPESRSYKEIAAALKISPNTMGSLRARCLKKLRKKLDELGY